MQILKVGKVSDTNENAAFNYFNSIRSNFDTIVLKSSSHNITLSNVRQIRFVGGVSSVGRRKKSDIEIKYSGGKFNISLKKEVFGSWESADTLAGDIVSEKILEYLMNDLEGITNNQSFQIIPYVESGKSKYKIVKKNTQQTVTLAYRCGTTDATKVIFGDDILNQGAVVSAIFPSGATHEDNIVTINCSHIIKTLREVPDDLYPYFAVKSSFYKKIRNQYRFPGLRIQALPKREIESAIFLPKLR